MIQPGVDLDAEIAKVVFHYVVIMDTATGEKYTAHAQSNTKRPIEKFSTSIDEAYKIINYLSVKGFQCHVRNSINDKGTMEWYAGFFNDKIPLKLYQGKTLPHAVCIAALQLAGRQSI